MREVHRRGGAGEPMVSSGCKGQGGDGKHVGFARAALGGPRFPTRTSPAFSPSSRPVVSYHQYLACSRQVNNATCSCFLSSSL